MKKPLYSDAYLREAPARVIEHSAEGGLILSDSLFYPNGGGQPGDAGELQWKKGSLPIVTTLKDEEGRPLLTPEKDSVLPPIGSDVVQRIDWKQRYRHMRVHTALHLLSVVIPLPVTGGQVSPQKGRLDFDMTDPPADKAELAAALQGLIDRDLPVTESWITDEDLEANSGLVKTMSVKPPMGQGRVRLVRIGEGDQQVDLQPCGGTHVARTSEIGRIAIGKIEKKGARNRRVNILLAT